MKMKNIIAIGISVILGVPLLVIIIGGNQGLLDLFHSRQELKESTQKIEQSRKVRDSLMQEKQKLLKDTAYLEKIAREKLGMAKDNEKVYKFVEEKE
ncbi:MAG: FtsB family cell division protein [Chitinispirillaceae bacterium]